MLRIALLPSWHAYSYIWSACGLRLSAAVHGRAHVPGSSTRHLVAQGLRIDTPEPFGQHQLVAGPAVRGPAVEVGRADHERVAFPVPTRVAEVLPQVGRQRRTAVDRHHAGFVDHLVADRHVAGALHHARVGVVDGRVDRVGHPARDAAVVEREVLVAVERPVAEAAAHAAAADGPAPRPKAPARAHRADRSRARCGATACRARANAAAANVAEPTAPALAVSAVSTSKSALSVASCLAACACRAANSASVSVWRSPNSLDRSNGTPSSGSLVHSPWRSGSPHGVFKEWPGAWPSRTAAAAVSSSARVMMRFDMRPPMAKYATLHTSSVHQRLAGVDRGP